MRKTIVLILMLIVFAATGLAQASQNKVPRWESNLSAGYIDYTSIQDPATGNVDDMNRHIGIVKAFWYYLFLPRIVDVGLSFDYIVDDLPICVNVALNLPTKFIVPFVCAGTGFSFSGSTLKDYGVGIKLRTGKRFGLIAEYRHYKIKKKSSGINEESSTVIRESAYFGGGIAYLF
jgi:hypothetical protein